ncbi:alginate lyase family protein [Halobacillus sp. GSS1]|uniref:alginate lyase family protein n=1 Tax=Halobacillus sp. GSS1 TaxID=2815919 RepID=UPI001A8D9C61|nr:alginate lyase family protein [Halobacillus sp. GSS1]MBN9655051.1 alginate lyase family protein [Halobacillus sp. GSS1]
MKRFVNKAKRLFSKPLGVITYRTTQELILESYRIINRWDRVEKNIDKSLTLTDANRQKNIILYDNLSLLKPNIYRYYDYYDGVTSRVRDGKYELLGHCIPSNFSYYWNEDWRFNYFWGEKYFRRYNYYSTEKSKPYDVKYPWELSRLNFLIPMALLVDETGCINKKDIFSILEDWEKNNPYCYSINWNPMECSIRVINLIILLEILNSWDNLSIEENRLFYRVLAKHGEFLYKTIEYTDVRGNHYTANLVALLLLGYKLEKIYKPSKRWLKNIVDKLDNELQLQFYDDGVNFEKAIGYHRLVTELFLLSTITLKKKNITLKNQSKLQNAISYVEAYLKDDLTAPVFGDNDNASILNFIFDIDIKMHSPILDIGKLFFEGTSYFGDQNDYPYFIFFGPIKEHQNVKKGDKKLSRFEEGGYIVYKTSDIYFFTDIGEVGMNGRGGHGHNDLLSYELEYKGAKLVVDPGSPTYTGDLAKLKKYRSTSMHNILQVEGKEIANLLGNWQIDNAAIPTVNEVKHTRNNLELDVSHTGYSNDFIDYSRKFFVEENREEFFRCIDQFTAIKDCNVTRYIHLDNSINFKSNNSDYLLICENTGKCFTLISDENSTISTEEFYQSFGYGIVKKSKKLILKSNCKQGYNKLYFSIKEI